MINATNENSGSTFEPLEQGTYIARCVKMIEIGTVTAEFQGKEKKQKKVRLTFELPTELKVFKEEDGEQPYFVSRDFTLSMHEKATLRGQLENWRGKKFTEEESKSFDVSVLLGKPCMVGIVHDNKDGKVYANISTISSLLKGIAVPEQITPSVILSYDNFDFAVFETLPEFIKDKMKETPEFKSIMNHQNEMIENVPVTDNENLPF